MDSLKKLQRGYPKSYKLLQSYLNLDFGFTKVRCPYWINKIDKKIRGPFGGKGLPGQLVGVTKRRALTQNIDLTKLNKKKLGDFLLKNRIGVDCSGFAYNLLNSLDKEKGGNGIADNIFNQKRFPDWNPAWRASANILTGKNVSFSVKTKNMRIGDTIRLDAGNHVAVIVDVSDKRITYAHSSKLLSSKRGVHLGVISIVDEDKDLSQQVWKEKTSDGMNLAKKFLLIKKGDGLRRFSWW